MGMVNDCFQQLGKVNDQERLMRKMLLTLLLFMATSAYGEPSGTFRYLMNEPLTLLEWGLYRLEKYTGTMKFEELDLIKVNSSVGYDWDKNRLQLGFVVYPKHMSLELTPAKELCGKMLLGIRSGFSAEFGDNIRDVMGISRFFERESFQSKSRPKSLMKDIENATVLQVHVYTSLTDKPPYRRVVHCEGSLMGEKVMFSD